MDKGAIRKAVMESIATIAPGTDVQALRANQPLRAQVDLDSMDWLNLVAAVGARLSVEIPAAEAAQLATLDDIVACVAALPAKASGVPASATTLLAGATYHVNGTTVDVRPMRADDAGLEVDFVNRLSPDSRYKRFMATVRELSPRKLKYLTDVDQVRHVALVATALHEGKPRLVGVVRYIIDPAGTGCEFSIAIDDDWHRTGLAGILMNALIGIASARGLATMEGIVLATNSTMLRFTRQLGFAQQLDPEDRTTFRVVRAL